jgi:hypothetical protein
VIRSGPVKFGFLNISLPSALGTFVDPEGWEVPDSQFGWRLKDLPEPVSITLFQLSRQAVLAGRAQQLSPEDKDFNIASQCVGFKVFQS